MFSALLWKEYREHRMVWAALALVGAATVLFLSMSFKAGGAVKRPVTEGQPFLAVALAGVYALICAPRCWPVNGKQHHVLSGRFAGVPAAVMARKICLRRRTLLGQIVCLMGLSGRFSCSRPGGKPDDLWRHDGGRTGRAVVGMLFSSFGRSVMNVILLSLAGYMALGFMAVQRPAFLRPCSPHYMALTRRVIRGHL